MVGPFFAPFFLPLLPHAAAVHCPPPASPMGWPTRTSPPPPCPLPRPLEHQPGGPEPLRDQARLGRAPSHDICRGWSGLGVPRSRGEVCCSAAAILPCARRIAALLSICRFPFPCPFNRTSPSTPVSPSQRTSETAATTSSACQTTCEGGGQGREGRMAAAGLGGVAGVQRASGGDERNGAVAAGSLMWMHVCPHILHSLLASFIRRPPPACSTRPSHPHRLHLLPTPPPLHHPTPPLLRQPGWTSCRSSSRPAPSCRAASSTSRGAA